MPTRDWRPLSMHLRRALHEAVDFVYPPACALCGVPRHTAASPPRLLCDACQTEVAPHYPHRCHRCSAPVGPYVDTSAGCIHCRSDRYAFERVMSLGPYGGALKDAILKVKQSRGDVLATALAELLVVNEPGFFDAAKFEVIVPVPHHWTDRLTSRHLPPETLAGRIARLLNVPLGSHILAKVRRTPPQTALEPTERRNNLRGAFRLIGRPQLAGSHVLLVDDVLTTGTTANRAASLLKQAGATVHVAVLARALGAMTPPIAPTAGSAGSAATSLESNITREPPCSA